MKRKASAKWQGNLKEGKGIVSTESGAVSQLPYSFSTRFEGQKGTNPEELIGAAHAGCFAMALSAELEKNHFVPKTIEVQASVNLDKVDGEWKIEAVHLDVSADIPNISLKKFEEVANIAKTNCPVSKLLKATITMGTHLENQKGQSSQVLSEGPRVS